MAKQTHAQAILSDRTVDLTVEETPDSVVFTTKASKLGNYVTEADGLALAKALELIVEQYRGDPRPFFIRSLDTGDTIKVMGDESFSWAVQRKTDS